MVELIKHSSKNPVTLFHNSEIECMTTLKVDHVCGKCCLMEWHTYREQWSIIRKKGFWQRTVYRVKATGQKWLLFSHSKRQFSLCFGLAVVYSSSLFDKWMCIQSKGFSNKAKGVTLLRGLVYFAKRKTLAGFVELFEAFFKTLSPGHIKLWHWLFDHTKDWLHHM